MRTKFHSSVFVYYGSWKDKTSKLQGMYVPSFIFKERTFKQHKNLAEKMASYDKKTVQEGRVMEKKLKEKAEQLQQNTFA